MTYRKTWFDYVLWAVYAGFCVTMLAYTGNRMYAFYVGDALAGLGAFLLFPVLLCLYPGIRLSCQAMRKKHIFSAHFMIMAEALAISVSFVFGTILRIREALLMASVYNLESTLSPGDYYELAVVRTSGWGFSFAHGMGDLFVHCLRFVLSFLGNSVAAAMLFQVFLQLAAMVFACLAVRKAAGRFASCMVLLLLAFSNYYIRKIDVIGPECLLITLFLAGLYLVVSFVKALLAGREAYGGLPGTFFLGVVLGFLCYLEGGCAVLLLFLAGVFTGKQRAVMRKKRQISSLLIAASGVLAGFFCAIAEDAAAGGVVFYQGLIWWKDTYLQPDMAGARLLDVIRTDYLFFALVFVTASFVVPSFIRNGRDQEFSLWLLPCILVTPAFLIDVSVSGFGGIAVFFWCVMAGLGLKGAALGGQAELVREKIEEINAAAQEAEKSQQEDSVASTSGNAAGPTEGGAMSDRDAPEKETAQAPQKKPRFIENPLPLPKKHVKRIMDYDYDVSEADMHYDLETGFKEEFDR